MKASDRKVVLILGGGIMQIPALRCARERGWLVLMADGNPEPEGKHLAHHFENVDLRDVEGMIAMARSYRQKPGLDGVFTAGTDFSLTVARVAEALGLPGIGVETAKNATFKDRMRRCFKESGVPSPEYRTLTGVEDLEGKLEGLPGPWVVKPVDNMGARGTRRVDAPGKLEEAVRSALSWSSSSRVVVEEYMDGPEFSIDAVVEDGELTVCGFADRHIFFPPYFIEMGHTMPSNAPAESVGEILRVFGLGVKALGIRTGCAKGDVKLTESGGKVGEIAARLSGGYMSGWTYPYSSGVDLTGAALNLAVGLPAGDLTPRYERHSAERAFISIPGEVESVHGVEKARQTAGVRDVFLRLVPGDRVRFPRNNVEKCGNVISLAETRREAVKAAETAAAAMAVRLVPGDPETGKFLFGKAEEGCPPIYRLDSLPASLPADMPPWDGDPETAGEGVVPGIISLPGFRDAKVSHTYGPAPEEGLGRVFDSGFCDTSDTATFRLGHIFWQAFLRGGPEAGIWVLRSFYRDGMKFLENVRIWSED